MFDNKMYSAIEKCFITMIFVLMISGQIEFMMIILGIYVVFLFGVCIEAMIKRGKNGRRN